MTGAWRENWQAVVVQVDPGLAVRPKRPRKGQGLYAKSLGEVERTALRDWLSAARKSEDAAVRRSAELALLTLETL